MSRSIQEPYRLTADYLTIRKLPMPAFSKDEIVFRTCMTLVGHIKNHVDEDRGGIHSRIFSHLLHPEMDFVYAGTSPEAKSQSTNHPEHVVPCVVLIEETRRLLKEGKLSQEEIAKLLQKHWKIVTITKEQAGTLDRTYKSTMPKDWCFETGNTMARLEWAGIKTI